MNKYPLIVVSICAVVLLVLGSLTNVVGYQSGIINTQICKNGFRYDNDTTPPVTTIYFNPETPDGDNGWYISNVTITLNATDNESGVNVTYYALDWGEWEIYGNPFTVTGSFTHLIEFYSIDKAGNVEVTRHVYLKIDEIPPNVQLKEEKIGYWKINFTATVDDRESGVDRVEFYLNKKLMFTDYEAPYTWTMTRKWLTCCVVCAIVYDKAGNKAQNQVTLNNIFIMGIIRNPEFFTENITFFAIMIFSNYDGIHMFEHFSFPTDYSGHIITSVE